MRVILDESDYKAIHNYHNQQRHTSERDEKKGVEFFSAFVSQFHMPNTKHTTERWASTFGVLTNNSKNNTENEKQSKTIQWSCKHSTRLTCYLIRFFFVSLAVNEFSHHCAKRQRSCMNPSRDLHYFFPSRYAIHLE